MATSSKPQHWLIGVAGRAGLGDLRDMRLPLDTPPAQAWEKAAGWLEISQEELAEGVAATFRMKMADLATAEPAASRVLPEADAQRLLVLPLRVTDRILVVATADPLDADAEKEISFVSGRNTEFEVSPPAPLRHAINHTYRAGDSEDFFITNEALAEASKQVHFVDEPATAHEQDLGGKAWAMVELTSLILLEAVKAEAELVMIDPMEAGGRVRFQVDGELQTFMRVPRQTLARITSRLKVLADIEEVEDVEGVESTESQTGEIHAHIQDLDYLVRISTTRKGDADQIVLWLTEHGAPVSATETKTEAVAAEGTAAAVTAAPAVPAPAVARSAPLALVVDDEPPDLLIMRAVMERLGFAVVEAVSGEEAVGHLDGDNDFDVMLLDLKMPGSDGLEVLKHVRGTLRTAALPVIIMTASPDPADENRLLAAGADDYIKKPIDPPWAVNRVRSVLRRAES